MFVCLFVCEREGEGGGECAWESARARESELETERFTSGWADAWERLQSEKFGVKVDTLNSEMAHAPFIWIPATQLNSKVGPSWRRLWHACVAPYIKHVIPLRFSVFLSFGHAAVNYYCYIKWCLCGLAPHLRVRRISHSKHLDGIRLVGRTLTRECQVWLSQLVSQ